MIGAMVGNFKIIEKIGEGGMGAVFRGVDVMLEREVAIKMLRPELANQPQVVERFRSEAVTLAKLNHPNIATLYSFLRQGEDFFMVMEFVRGETLDDVIRKYGAMSVERAIAMFCHALEGIEHAHRLGIIHRDIKPANMMLTEDGTIKVMDFGIARVLGSARMTRQGSIVGTIEYMSPEQVRGLESDARSDIYSLGILLYEMLTGRVPFFSESEFTLMKSQIEDAPTPPRVFSPHIPLAVEQAIMRSLAKKAEARFQTAGEFRAVLLQSIGAATNPLNAPGPVYAAPATRLGEPVARTSHTMPEAKETRLAGETILGGAPSHPSGVVGAQPRETRLAPSGSYDQYPPTQHVYPPTQQVYMPQPSATHSSVFSRLNWKHYAGIGVALVMLLAIPFVVLSNLTGNTPQSEPEAAQPALTPPSEPPSSATTSEPSSTPVDQTAPQTVPIEGEQPAAGNSNPDTSRSGRSRDGRSSQTPEASGGTTSQPEQPAVSHNPPQQSTPAPAQGGDKPATQKEPDKKPEAKDDKNALEKVGSGIKKVFGFGGKKDKDKKDDKKKKDGNNN